MEEKRKNDSEERSVAAAIPFLTWLGKIIAGWAVSRWITHLWNKYVRKNKDEQD